jgi:hypothetical protein
VAKRPSRKTPATNTAQAPRNQSESELKASLKTGYTREASILLNKVPERVAIVALGPSLNS